MAYIAIRNLLRLRLSENGMTQQELATKIGMPIAQVNDYFHNRKGMTLNTAKTLAEGVGCTIDDLFEWRHVRRKVIRSRGKKSK